MITPNTNITLLKTPFELDSMNQLTFASKEAQYNYFSSLPKISYDNATYQRKEGVIRFPTSLNTVTYEDLLEYNYCMYQNDSYDEKWFYAYITDITYDNDGMSLITIKTDVFQTWQFDIVYKQSFIEREMLSTNADIPGANTIPEDVETGEYLPQSYTVMNYGTPLANPYYVCLAVSENLLDNQSGIFQYNNNYCGFQYIVIRDETSLKNLLTKYNNAGKIDAIYSLFIIPGMFAVVNNNPVSWDSVDNIYYTRVDKKEDEFEIKEITLSRPSQLGYGSDLYTPKNKKLLTNQFVYILCDNQNGVTAKYSYEYFNDPTACKFKSIGAISPGCSIKAFPLQYKYNDTYYGYCEGIIAGKLPIGGWYNDVYTNWLTQNGVNIGLSITGSTLQIAGGLGLALGTGGAGALTGATNITSGALGIANTISQVYSHSLAPNQAEGNLNAGDVNLASNRIYPTYYQMSIKKEYAIIIDDFFSMYGYKTNRVKLPNLNNRSNWNYVKTINCNIIGDIPQNDMQEIKDLFNNGITLWHNASTFLDYSQTNS